jgi:hypothetical protein
MGPRHSHLTLVPGGGPGLTFEQLRVMEEKARQAAASYAKRVHWVDRRELEQTAWVEMLRAVRETWDEDEGTPFGAFCWLVARNALQRAVFKAAAPVSASHRIKVLANLRHAEVEAPTQEPDAPREEREEVSALNVHNRPDEVYELAARAHAVRERVRALVGERGEPFAFAVCNQTFAPAQIAAEHGVTVEYVYHLRTRVKNILRADQALYDLWKEAVEEE